METGSRFCEAACSHLAENGNLKGRNCRPVVINTASYRPFTVVSLQPLVTGLSLPLSPHPPFFAVSLLPFLSYRFSPPFSLLPFLSSRFSLTASSLQSTQGASCDDGSFVANIRPEGVHRGTPSLVYPTLSGWDLEDLVLARLPRQVVQGLAYSGTSSRVRRGGGRHAECNEGRTC